MPDWLLHDRTLLWLAAAAYGLACVWRLPELRKAQAVSSLGPLACLAVGFAAQTFGLYLRGLKTGGCPIGNVFEVIQFVGWTAMAIVLVVGPAFRLSLLGFFTAGFAFLVSFASLLIPALDPEKAARLKLPPLVELHAATALFSYGFFAVLALCSAMWLVEEFGLKHRRLNRVYSLLPPLVETDRMNRRLLLAGFTTLTLSYALITARFLQAPDSVAPLKIAFSWAVWLAYAGIILAYLTNRLLARRFAWA